MGALDDYMSGRVRFKELRLTKTEARVVERALRAFEPMSRDDKAVAAHLADRLKLAPLRGALKRANSDVGDDQARRDAKRTGRP